MEAAAPGSIPPKLDTPNRSYCTHTYCCTFHALSDVIILLYFSTFTSTSPIDKHRCQCNV